jgi:streptothricin acetyltransferase
MIMNIQIREINQDNLAQINQCDNSFQVEKQCCLFTRGDDIYYTLAPARKFMKRYPPETLDYTSYIGNPEKTVFFAYTDGQLAGQIILRKNWNGYAYIEDIAVDTHFRRQGIGRLLMERAAKWAKSKNLPGIMLETSSINVTACQFYEHFGFKLGGFDRFLYQAVIPGTEEVAIFWYLIFMDESNGKNKPGSKILSLQ